MTAKQKKLFLLTSMMSVFVMAVAVLFTGGKLSSFRTPFARATNSGNYSISFNRSICGGSDYNTNDYTKQTKLVQSGTAVYAHAHNTTVTSGTDFARFSDDKTAYIEFYIDSDMRFQEITGFSLTYNATYPRGDFDIYLSSDGTSYPETPNAQVRDAPSSVELSANFVKKIKFAGVDGTYAYFNTITINYSCGEAPAKTLSSIDISGQTTVFDVNDSFEFGGTVTAYYNDTSSANVTSSAVIDSSLVDMTSAGEYTVNVSYTEAGTTKSTSYSITVNSSGGGVTLSGTYNYESRAESGSNRRSWADQMWIEFDTNGTCEWRTLRTGYISYRCRINFTYTTLDTGSAINFYLTQTSYYFEKQEGPTASWQVYDSAAAWLSGGYDRPVSSSFVNTNPYPVNNTGVMASSKAYFTISVFNSNSSYAYYDTFTFTLAS